MGSVGDLLRPQGVLRPRLRAGSNQEARGAEAADATDLSSKSLTHVTAQPVNLAPAAPEGQANVTRLPGEALR